MKSPDTYQTLKTRSEGIYKEKGSKFLAYAFPVNNVDDVKKKLDEVKELHPKARHHCYAYLIGMDDNNYRANDAGEPSGSAGLPILGQIRSHEITNTLIVVVRYFGGTKLGVSGLINAYKIAAADAIANNTIIEKNIADYYRIDFNYDLMSTVMRICKEHQIEPVDQTFEMNCSITIAINQSRSKQIIEQFDVLQDVKTQYLYTA